MFEALKSFLHPSCQKSAPAAQSLTDALKRNFEASTKAKKQIEVGRNTSMRHLKLAEEALALADKTRGTS